MSEETWRDRLAAAIEKNGKTKRGVSLAAGLNPGYVHSLLVEGKDPTIDNLIAVCEKAGVALSYVMYGFEITAEAEEILRELAAAAPDQRKAMLTLLRKPSPETGEAQP